MGKYSNPFRWETPIAGKNKNGINVSSRGEWPYSKLSPFSYDRSYNIPVPGNEDIRSQSVEGIWQGLKIIRGMPDFLSFTGRPRKRRGKPEGHLFGQEILGYVDARKKIYVPAYVYHVINNVLEDVKKDLEELVESGHVTLYDVESNGSISDISKPYSHAALLVKLLNLLKNSPLPPFNKKHFNYLHEQVNALLEYRSKLKNDDAVICDDILTFAYLFSPDELKATFALRAIKEGNIDDVGRLRKYSPTAKTQEPNLFYLLVT